MTVNSFLTSFSANDVYYNAFFIIEFYFLGIVELTKKSRLLILFYPTFWSLLDFFWMHESNRFIVEHYSHISKNSFIFSCIPYSFADWCLQTCAFVFLVLMQTKWKQEKERRNPLIFWIINVKKLLREGFELFLCSF